ncbi:MAG TPA: ROK family protein [Acidimicrobiales bacterium]|nr:ROK family protein [Acidimicrobiales bacterium]
MARSLVVGLDNGGTANNATVLDTAAGDGAGVFLVDALVETPSRVLEGPEAAVDALVSSLEGVLARTGSSAGEVGAVGLDTPGPASADGVISSQGATNFSAPAWHGFDIRGALEKRLGLPVVYNNDGNAAALYAHRMWFGPRSGEASSVALVVGTGLGGGIVERGRVVKGASGVAGELGHVHIPMDGLLQDGQPVPGCNCGFAGDAESVASLTGITRNLLPYWLTRFPDHELASLPVADAARAVRGLGERGDAMARAIFGQQAKALGRLFTIVARVLDPEAYFVGGGVVEAGASFRDWFMAEVRANTDLYPDQSGNVTFGLVPDLDMAGARGAALAAAEEAGLLG